ncbi:MAG TPA: hypothetical protein VLY82_00795 [Nitrososphaerales archaeon]|nr:hypothetical protein [Nitrososphaerales archaeon]
MDGHALDATEVMYSPLLAKARKDPRYQVLVAKVRMQTSLAK